MKHALALLILLTAGASPVIAADESPRGIPVPAQAISLEIYAGAHHGFDGLRGEVRTRQLPNGRSVSLGPDPAARAAARLRVAAFLAAQP